MRASNLIISTLAVLVGGTSLAIGQGGGSLQSGGSTQGAGAISQGGIRGSESAASNPRAAENPMRRSEISGERGSNVQGSRDLQRSRPMTTERGRTLSGERGPTMSAERGRGITGERGQAVTAERGAAATGQGPKTAAQIQGQAGPHARQGFRQQPGLVYARANARETGAALTPEQRARLREIVAARRDIPRVSNLADVRVNAVIPRSVRLAAIPEEVVRIYPRFRRHQAFIYRNEIVVVDPVTSRIVAVLPA